jgi:hypothetical protein
MAISGVIEWLVSIPTAIWGSLLTGLLTLLGVVVGQIAIYYREKQEKNQETENLRSALITELRTIDEWLEFILHASHDIERVEANNYRFSVGEYEDIFENDFHAKIGLLVIGLERMSIPRDVYESNVGKIGELEADTVKAVIDAYRSIDSLKQSLQELGDLVEIEEMVLESDFDQSAAEILTRVEYTENEVLTAITRQKEALRQLGDDVNESDLTAVLLAFTEQSPQSEQQERTQEGFRRYIEEHSLSLEEISRGDHPMAQEEGPGS